MPTLTGMRRRGITPESIRRFCDLIGIANTRPELKRTVGWVAYVDGAARSLVSAKPFRIVYQLDDQRLHSARVQSILFATCEEMAEADMFEGSLPELVHVPFVLVAPGLEPGRFRDVVHHVDVAPTLLPTRAG